MIKPEMINSAKMLRESLTPKKWLSSVGVISTEDKFSLVVYINTKMTKTIEKLIPKEYDGYPVVVNQLETIEPETPKNVRYV